MKPSTQRILIRRKYNDVHKTLKEIFKIPDNEYPASLEWDKELEELILITIQNPK